MKVSGKYLDNLDTRGYHAACDGRALHKFVNDKVIGTTDATVLTDSTVIYNLSEGEQVVMTQAWLNLSTASDNAHMELGSTDQASGAGTFTAYTHHLETATGAANAFGVMQEFSGFPVGVIKYSSGARCVTLRVTVNDNSASVTAAWRGWVEKEK